MVLAVMRFAILVTAILFLIGCNQPEAVLKAESDLNGDETPEKITMHVYKKGAKLYIRDGQDPGRKKKLQFGVGGKTRASFCGPPIRLKPVDIKMPLNEWGCPDGNEDQECRVLRNIEKNLTGLHKKKASGLLVGDGQCDDFFIYFNPTLRRYTWWRQ